MVMLCNIRPELSTLVSLQEKRIWTTKVHSPEVSLALSTHFIRMKTIRATMKMIALKIPPKRGRRAVVREQRPQLNGAPPLEKLVVLPDSSTIFTKVVLQYYFLGYMALRNQGSHNSYIPFCALDNHHRHAFSFPCVDPETVAFCPAKISLPRAPSLATKSLVASPCHVDRWLTAEHDLRLQAFTAVSGSRAPKSTLLRGLPNTYLVTMPTFALDMYLLDFLVNKERAEKGCLQLLSQSAENSNPDEFWRSCE